MHVCVCLLVCVLMTPWLCLRSFLCAVMKWFQCLMNNDPIQVMVSKHITGFCCLALCLWVSDDLLHFRIKSVTRGHLCTLYTFILCVQCFLVCWYLSIRWLWQVVRLCWNVCSISQTMAQDMSWQHKQETGRTTTVYMTSPTFAELLEVSFFHWIYLAHCPMRVGLELWEMMEECKFIQIMLTQ